MQPTRKFATKTRTEWSQTSDFISKKSKKSWTKRYRPPWRKWSTMLWDAELWANRCLIQSARESSCWDLGVSRSSVVWLLARSKDKTLESPVAFFGMKNMIRGSMLCLKVLNCSRLQLSMASIKNNLKITLQFENSKRTLNHCIIGFWESSCLITSFSFVGWPIRPLQRSTARNEHDLTLLFASTFWKSLRRLITKYLYNSWTVFVP